MKLEQNNKTANLPSWTSTISAVSVITSGFISSRKCDDQPEATSKLLPKFRLWFPGELDSSRVFGRWLIFWWADMGLFCGWGLESWLEFKSVCCGTLLPDDIDVLLSLVLSHTSLSDLYERSSVVCEGLFTGLDKEFDFSLRFFFKTVLTINQERKKKKGKLMFIHFLCILTNMKTTNVKLSWVEKLYIMRQWLIMTKFNRWKRRHALS